jgi:hypothetical protein
MSNPPGEKRVSHPVNVQRGQDVYPPELLAQARANSLPGEYGEKRESHPVNVQRGQDVYPPELLAQARAGEAEGSPAGCDRVVELQSLTTQELLLLVRGDRAGESLTVDDIQIIHDIAVSRLTAGDDPSPDDARELSRAVLRLALSRVA